MHAFEVLPLGDSALLFRSAARTDVDSLLHIRDRLTSARIEGVTEVVMGYESVAIFADPAAIDSATAQIVDLVESAVASEPEPAAAKVVEIPVCYDGEFALDLEAVAAQSGLRTDEVIRLHVTGDYTVRCVGFTPGFPYLSGLPQVLATPRRSSPRTKVPAGSVAIGGRQTGIYPTASPGGWNVIGRTPLQLFDPHRDAPALLRAGDRVRFRSITRDEFSAA